MGKIFSSPMGWAHLSVWSLGAGLEGLIPSHVPVQLLALYFPVGQDMGEALPHAPAVTIACLGDDMI